MITSIAVVVPAADEAETLGDCLAALRVSRSELSGALPVRTIVVLDGCTDTSAEVAARFAEVETVSVSARRVGAARRSGANVALSGTVRAERLWLASTDADSLVPAHWLSTMLELANDGADLVLGTVVPAGAHREAALAAGYEPGDGHPHVHGANLGIRGSTYQRVGGWPELATGEDHALLARATDIGARIRRSGALAVATSTRLDARAPAGYSSYLRGLLAAADGEAS